MKTSSARSEALTEPAKSIPARSLGDSAAHLGLAYSSIDDFKGVDLDEHEMAVNIRQLLRCVISALQVVAQAGDVSVRDIGGEWLADAFDRQFFGPGGGEAA